MPEPIFNNLPLEVNIPPPFPSSPPLPSLLTRHVATTALGGSLQVSVLHVGLAGRGDEGVGKGNERLLGAVTGVGLMVLPLHSEEGEEKRVGEWGGG